MTILAVAGRVLVALTSTAALAAWILLAACLTVTAAGFILDAITGGVTP